MLDVKGFDPCGLSVNAIIEVIICTYLMCMYIICICYTILVVMYTVCGVCPALRP